MAPSTPDSREVDSPRLLDEAALGELLEALRGDGYQLLGPRRVGQVIDYAPLERADELPQGIGAEQSPGRYRLLEHTGSDAHARFAYAAPASSFKRHFFAPKLVLLRAKRSEDTESFRVLSAQTDAPPKLALIGARACDLHAIVMQDHILGGASGRGPADTDYVARRSDVFVVAVNCGHPASTCFCTSTGTGPRAKEYFDVALSELTNVTGVRYLARAGSDRGAALLERLTTTLPGAEELTQEADLLQRAEASIERALPLEGLAAALQQNLESPIWTQIAERCLSCSNCTLACPTCFCSSVEDSSSFDGQSAERSRRWDSCFTADHSYVHGGSVRSQTSSRYRQWLTHKLATWREQLGAEASVPHESADASGCVGCGRCITWCPAGIDITREARRLRDPDGQSTEGTRG
ncbi:MAG: 4Fe-4S dicluster domain-containing protein [Polyangiaceae bacterium]|nr:4Fe-4S dicluster domain-containing protein [Polyangiaceae bacterium]